MNGLRFHTFLFTPDWGRSDILTALIEKVAGNCLVISQEDRYDDGVITGVDVELGCWATDEEWSVILSSWKTYCDKHFLPAGYLE